MAHTHKHEQKIWKLTSAQQSEIEKSAQSLRSSEEEFEAAFEVLKKYPKRVTFFGSARLSPHYKSYQWARELASDLSDDGFAILTGGGGGIMEAGNRGAIEDKHVSIGFNITLPHEQHLNEYTSDHLTFDYFFTRKVMMTFYSHGSCASPGDLARSMKCLRSLHSFKPAKCLEYRLYSSGKSSGNPSINSYENTC
jgi:hypothetical protein